uniref:Telomeric repeat-binding factor 2-interacting protein 1 n=1 Tax=Amphilophus citrinellus TaxID=61819 RepID=A0A3Q0SHZ2_AMPCI
TASRGQLTVLFLTVEGEPMCFFLRPGPIKSKLQPLITAGGGMLCNVQQPGAILLIDPEERSTIPESTAHWYVSTQYIHDCIEKDEQLNLEDYKLNPEVQRHSARLNSSKNVSPQLTGGMTKPQTLNFVRIVSYTCRNAYSPEEDAAILNYVSKHKTETGGNRLWQEMEKQCVTSHSWQSMKYRYKARLAETQLLTAETTEAERDGPQVTVSPQKQSLSGESPPKTSSSKKPREKQKVSPMLEQKPRRMTRRQLELEPYGKKLRSSSTQTVQSTSSPEPLKKTKSAVKSALQKGTTLDQPPPKKARGKTVAAEAESDEEQNTPATVSETAQAGFSRVKEHVLLFFYRTFCYRDVCKCSVMWDDRLDLISVTKTLLKTSGDFSAALDLLLNPSSISGPFWNRCDDRLLLSADPVVFQQLQEKYGEESVAKRIVFLEVEG